MPIDAINGFKVNSICDAYEHLMAERIEKAALSKSKGKSWYSPPNNMDEGSEIVAMWRAKTKEKPEIVATLSHEKAEPFYNFILVNGLSLVIDILLDNVYLARCNKQSQQDTIESISEAVHAFNGMAYEPYDFAELIPQLWEKAK